MGDRYSYSLFTLLETSPPEKQEENRKRAFERINDQLLTDRNSWMKSYLDFRYAKEILLGNTQSDAFIQELFDALSYPLTLVDVEQALLQENKADREDKIEYLFSIDTQFVLLHSQQNRAFILNQFTKVDLNNILRQGFQDPQKVVDRLQSFGFTKEEGEKIFKAWSGNSFIIGRTKKPDVLQTIQSNIIAMQEIVNLIPLDEDKRRVLPELFHDFGIHNFARYPAQLLADQYLQRDNLDTPYGVIMYPMSDWNGAFLKDRDVFSNLHKDLQGKYLVRVVEVADKREMAGAFMRLHQRYAPGHQLGKKKIENFIGKPGHRIEFVFVGGHGTPTYIDFGRDKLELNDVANINIGTQRMRQILVDIPSIVLISCSTGAEGGIAQQISKIFTGISTGPDVPTGIKSVTVRFGRNGKPIFHIAYTKTNKEIVYATGEVIPTVGFEAVTKDVSRRVADVVEQKLAEMAEEASCRIGVKLMSTVFTADSSDNTCNPRTNRILQAGIVFSRFIREKSWVAYWGALYRTYIYPVVSHMRVINAELAVQEVLLDSPSSPQPAAVGEAGVPLSQLPNKREEEPLHNWIQNLWVTHPRIASLVSWFNQEALKYQWTALPALVQGGATVLQQGFHAIQHGFGWAIAGVGGGKTDRPTVLIHDEVQQEPILYLSRGHASFLIQNGFPDVLFQDIVSHYGGEYYPIPLKGLIEYIEGNQSQRAQLAEIIVQELNQMSVAQIMENIKFLQQKGVSTENLLPIVSSGLNQILFEQELFGVVETLFGKEGVPSDLVRVIESHKKDHTEKNIAILTELEKKLEIEANTIDLTDCILSDATPILHPTIAGLRTGEATFPTRPVAMADSIQPDPRYGQGAVLGAETDQGNTCPPIFQAPLLRTLRTSESRREAWEWVNMNVFPPVRSAVAFVAGMVGYTIGGEDTSFGIQRMTRAEYTAFLEQLQRWIGSIVTIDPMFWMWRLSDFSAGLAIAGGVAFVMHFGTALSAIGFEDSFMKRLLIQIQKPAEFVIATGFGLLAEYWKNGALNDLYDTAAIVGGISTYFLAERLFSLLRSRGWSIGKGISVLWNRIVRR